jgi:hypothetical protein
MRVIAHRCPEVCDRVVPVEALEAMLEIAAELEARLAGLAEAVEARGRGREAGGPEAQAGLNFRFRPLLAVSLSRGVGGIGGHVLHGRGSADGPVAGLHPFTAPRAFLVSEILLAERVGPKPIRPVRTSYRHALAHLVRLLDAAIETLRPENVEALAADHGARSRCGFIQIGSQLRICPQCPSTATTTS